MGSLLIEYETDRPPGAADDSDRRRTLRLGKAPRAKWIFGGKARDGVTNYSDDSKGFVVIHDSPGSYELRIEALSPNRPAEDPFLEGFFGFVGDAWARAMTLVSVVSQGIPFDLTLDDFSSDDDPTTTPRRRAKTVLRRSLSSGTKDVRIQDKYWGGSVTGGLALDAFAAGDIVFLEDVRDPTRYEFAKVFSVPGVQAFVTVEALRNSYEAGSSVRHAFYFPKCLGTTIRFAERAGRKSPGVEVWDLTVRFEEVRNMNFHQIIESS